MLNTLIPLTLYPLLYHIKREFYNDGHLYIQSKGYMSWYCSRVMSASALFTGYGRLRNIGDWGQCSFYFGTRVSESERRYHGCHIRLSECTLLCKVVKAPTSMHVCEAYIANLEFSKLKKNPMHLVNTKLLPVYMKPNRKVTRRKYQQLLQS